MQWLCLIDFLSRTTENLGLTDIELAAVLCVHGLLFYFFLSKVALLRPTVHNVALGHRNSNFTKLFEHFDSVPELMLHT